MRAPAAPIRPGDFRRGLEIRADEDDIGPALGGGERAKSDLDEFGHAAPRVQAVLDRSNSSWGFAAAVNKAAPLRLAASSSAAPCQTPPAALALPSERPSRRLLPVSRRNSMAGCCKSNDMFSAPPLTRFWRA